MGANVPVPHGAPAVATRRRQDRTALIIVLAVAAVTVLLFIGGPIAVYVLARPGNLGATLVDAKDVPTLIRKHMPCKRSCAVTMVSLHSSSISVNVLSEEIEGRTLMYRVDAATGAELRYSNDALDPGSLLTIDLDEVDWSVADKLVRELEAKAVSGRSVRSVNLSPCEHGKEANGPVRACFKADVLTEKGDLKLTLDAKTGKRR